MFTFSSSCLPISYCSVDNVDPAGTEDDDLLTIQTYATNAKISIKDSQDRAMAHGYIMDDEPEIPSDDEVEKFGKAHHGLLESKVGSFKRIQLTNFCRCVVFHFVFSFNLLM